HDHKVDPSPQLDYYRLKAALDGAKHGNRSILTVAETKARAAEAEKYRALIITDVKDSVKIETRVRSRALTAAGRTIPPEPIAMWAFRHGGAEDVIGDLHGALNGGAEVSLRLKLNGTGAFVKTMPLSVPLREET